MGETERRRIDEGEAGRAGQGVVPGGLAPSAYGALPPLLTADGAIQADGALPDAPPYIFHLFVAPTAGRDYQRRLRMAAERRLGAMGAAPHLPGTNE